MKDLIHIKKLFQYLEAKRIGDDTYITLESSRSVLLSENDTKKDKAYATLIRKRSGALVIEISSWNESHHNGDPYACSDRSIPLVPPFNDDYENFGDGAYGEGNTIQKVLSAIEMDLETQAVEKAHKEYNENKQKEEEVLVREFLYTKLGY